MGTAEPVDAKDALTSGHRPPAPPIDHLAEDDPSCRGAQAIE